MTPDGPAARVHTSKYSSISTSESRILPEVTSCMALHLSTSEIGRDLILETIRSLQPGVPAIRAAGAALADQNGWIGRAIR